MILEIMTVVGIILIILVARANMDDPDGMA